MDFSKYYPWNKSESDEYNLEQKQMWTENAKESFEDGQKAYAQNKSIDQNPFINIVKRTQFLVDTSEQEANDLLEHSTDPKNTVSKICSRFEHNLEWWNRGWKMAYHEKTGDN